MVIDPFFSNCTQDEPCQ